MADHFDDNPLITTLRRIYFGDGETANEVYDAYCQQFLQMDDTNRRSDLLIIDAYLNDNAAATREYAALVQQRRHLGDIDVKLRKARR
jgi:hypothetical protein